MNAGIISLFTYPKGDHTGPLKRLLSILQAKVIPLSYHYSNIFNKLAHQKDLKYFDRANQDVITCLLGFANILSKHSINECRTAMLQLAQGEVPQEIDRSKEYWTWRLDDIEYYNRIFSSYQFNITDNIIASPWKITEEQQFSIPLKTLIKINEEYKREYEKMQKMTGYTQVCIPPLATLALDGIKSTKDFVQRMTMLRDKYRKLRESFISYGERLDKANSVREHANIYDEIQETFHCLEVPEKRTRILSSFWNVVKDGSLLKLATSPLDALYEYDKQKQIRYRLNGMYDILSSAKDVATKNDLISSVFKSSPSPDQIKALDSYVQAVNKQLHILPS